MRRVFGLFVLLGILTLAARPTDSHATTGQIVLNAGDLQIQATVPGTPDVHIDVHIETGMPVCGIGFELAFLMPPLMWAYGRRRRLIH